MSIRLQGLPALLELWDQLVTAAAAQGITIDVADYGGFRTAADTADILNYRDADYKVYVAAQLAAGLPIADENTWRPIAQFGQSLHDYGAARDVKIVSAPSTMSGLAVVAAIDTAAESLGLSTGASYGDPLHVQLPISVDEAAGEWNDYVAAGGGAPSSSSASSAAAWIVLAAAIGAVVTVKYSRGIASWR